MKIKYIIILLFALFSCNDEASESPLTDDCPIGNVFSCTEINQTKIEYCFDCTFCNQDKRMSNEDFIYFYVETLPTRAGNSYDTIYLNKSTNLYSGSICVPFIESQDSLVVGLVFNSELEGQNHAVYSKIPINKNGVTTFIKTIMEDDIFERPPCDYKMTVSGSFPDETVQDIKYIACIVGSPEDCVVGNFENNPELFLNEGIDKIEESLLDWYNFKPTATLCGEINILILE